MTTNQRRLVLSSFVNRLGTGLFATTSILYFTRIRHLNPESIGIGLTIAGAIGLLSGIPVGHLADRRGPRLVTIVTLLIQAVTMTTFLFVRNWQTFTILATLDQLAMSANNACRGALIGRVGGDDAAAFRARLRGYVNMAMLLGSGGAVIVIQIDTVTAYTALILFNTATFLLAAALLLRVPSYMPQPNSEKVTAWSVLKDRQYTVFAAINGILGFHYVVFAIVLPIWISAHTSAPRWNVALAFLLNGALCIVLQVRLGSKVKTLNDGSIALRRTGLLLLVSCGLFALATGVSAWAATTLILVAVIVHSVGEVLHASAGFALGFGLAPDHRQGQYQGLLGMLFDLGQAVGPALLAYLCLSHGRTGWMVLALMFATLGLLGQPVVRVAIRGRQGKVVA
jgi:MFS family permease